jgi:hypothetical protein
MNGMNRLPPLNYQQMISPITQIHIKHMPLPSPRMSIPQHTTIEVTEMQQPPAVLSQQRVARRLIAATSRYRDRLRAVFRVACNDLTGGGELHESLNGPA